jgi:DNA-binding transcriptional MerR regulator
MDGITMADLEKILMVKSHVIRFWEKEIPLIQPKKDKQGYRNIYSKRDVSIFLRLKYLLYEKRYTIKGAREALFKELSGVNQDKKAIIDEIRSELLDVYWACSKTESVFEEFNL